MVRVVSGSCFVGEELREEDVEEDGWEESILLRAAVRRASADSRAGRTTEVRAVRS